MDDALSSALRAIESNRETFSQLRKSQILGKSDESTNLLEYKDIVEDILSWTRWIERQDRQSLARYFSLEDLGVISARLQPSSQILLQIQNDRRNDNRPGRIFVDTTGLINEILTNHSQLLVIGHARAQSRPLLLETQRLSNDAQETLDETKKLVALKAVGTLAEYFQNLVVPSADVDKPRKFWQSGYEARARRWFWLTVVVALASAVYAAVIVFLIDKINSTDSASLLTAKVLLKVLALAIPLLLIRICTRNYGAFTHLAAMNKHRTALMQTVMALKQDTDAETQRGVLVEVIKLVGDPGETGLISRNEGAGDSDININAPLMRQ